MLAVVPPFSSNVNTFTLSNATLVPPVCIREPEPRVDSTSTTASRTNIEQYNLKLSIAKKKVDMLAKLFRRYEPIIFMATEFHPSTHKSDGNLYLYILDEYSFMKDDIEHFAKNCNLSPEQYFQQIKLKNSDFADDFISTIDCDLLYSSMTETGDKLQIFYPLVFVGDPPKGSDIKLVNELETYCKTIKINDYNL